MRGFVNGLGWILFLLLAAVVLIVYNVVYVPQDNRVARLKTEIDMWTRQVETLSDSLRQAGPGSDTAVSVSLLQDVLFAGTDSFRVCAAGQTLLREHVAKLQEGGALIRVIGHTDNSAVPERLRGRYPTNWDLAAARAAAVATELVGWGIPARRVEVVSAGETRPVADNATPTGRASNRRVQVVMLKR